MATGNNKKNLKAGMFEAYTKREGLHFFRRQDAHDSYDTVVFMTALPAGKNHRLVCAVITDNSMYVMVRVHLGTSPKGPARHTFMNYLNDLNGHHAIVKYSIGTDDNVFADVCICARDEKFDPSVVRSTLDLLVVHLNDHYDDIVLRLDKPGDETSGFSI